MKRRTFLKSSAAAVITGQLGIASRLLGAPIASEKTKPIKLGNLPLLFADDSGLADCMGVHRTFHPARTRSEPVLEADRPWENGRVYIYGSVFYDEATREFRMWYGTPKPSFVLQATSRDGVHWEKPSLGLHEYAGARENNIVLQDVHSPSLLRDLSISDTQRRYKLIGSREHIGYLANYSSDGLHWIADPKNPVLQGDDTLTVTQCPNSGEYLLYHKRQVSLRGSIRRTVWLSRSRDFQNWTEPQLTFAPDEKDDDWAGPGQRTDVYDMSVFPHAGGFLGFPAMFQVARVRPKSALVAGQAGDDGPITIQIATSRDGAKWTRSTLRTSMIPLGAKGTFDRGAILGVSNQLIHHGDETWLYYTALSTTHGEAPPAKKLTIGRAEWRLHGFASLACTDAIGTVRTRPLLFENNNLQINADASKGILKVGLLDENSRPVPGLSLKECIPLRRNLVGWTPRWRSEARVPTDRPLRVIIEMENARLFSISTSSAQ